MRHLQVESNRINYPFNAIKEMVVDMWLPDRSNKVVLCHEPATGDLFS